MTHPNKGHQRSRVGFYLTYDPLWLRETPTLAYEEHMRWKEDRAANRYAFDTVQTLPDEPTHHHMT